MKWEPGLLFLHFGYCHPDKDWIMCVKEFPHVYKKDWFYNEYNAKLATVIDKSPMVMPGVFDSPVFGYISFDRLSGGSQTLILANMIPDRHYPLNYLGENCMDMLYELTCLHEVHFVFNDYMPLINANQKIYVPEKDVLLTTPREFKDWGYDNPVKDLSMDDEDEEDDVDDEDY